MILSPSASVHNHRVDVCLSPVEPLPMTSYNLFGIFILPEIIEMQVREREQLWIRSRNGKNPPKHMWLTASRVDPGLKNWVLDGSL
jgi:hypothetical protein